MQVEYLEIDGEKYKVHFSMLAIKLFEELAQKPITKITTTWDNYLFFYCTLKALNEKFDYTLEQFTEITDNNPGAFINFQTFDVLADNDPFNQEAGNEVKKKITTQQIFMLWTLSGFAFMAPVLLPIISIPVWIGASIWLLLKIIKEVGSRQKQ